MNDYEKDISFLNRFFVYKKTSTRNAEKLTKALLDQLPDAIEFEQEGTLLARESVEKAEEIIRPKARKLKDRLKLQDATEALEETLDEVIDIPKKVTKKKKAAKVDIIEEI